MTQPWQADLDRKCIVIWRCEENPKHRGWRDESKPEEVGRRGTCDYCLARTAFERELSPSGVEERPTRVCPDCDGAGRCPDCEDVYPANENCPTCGKYAGTCRRCSGTGSVQAAEAAS